MAPAAQMALSAACLFVTAEIVHDDEVAGWEGWDEELHDIGGEELAVDRAFEHAGRVDPVAAQGSHKGQRLPLAERSFGDELAAAFGPTPQRRHISLGPGLVDEDQPLGIKSALILLPLRAPPRDLQAILLLGEQAFFLKL